MAVVIVPLSSDVPHFDQSCQLDGTTYGIEVRWNERAGQWFLTLRDSNDDLIRAGVGLVVDFPIAVRSADARKPPGALVLVDTSNERRDPDGTDLGTRVQLVYFEASELPATPA